MLHAGIESRAFDGRRRRQPARGGRARCPALNRVGNVCRRRTPADNKRTDIQLWVSGKGLDMGSGTRGGTSPVTLVVFRV